jgi:CRISPR-associated protein Cmx8
MSETLTLEYNLAELPSSQHRAGLAGLVLMVRWLAKEPDKKGICEIKRIDETSATLQIDQEGLQFLFDKVYAASSVESGQDKPWEKKLSKKDLEQNTIRINLICEIPFLSMLSDEPIPFGKLLLTDSEEKSLWIKIWEEIICKTLTGKYIKDKKFQSVIKEEYIEKWHFLSGICDFEKVNEGNAVLQIKRENLQQLFTNAETDFEVDLPVKKEKPTNEKFLKIPRFIKITASVEKQSKEQFKIEYVYGKAIPKGAFLNEYDRSGEKIWLKLWQDMIWKIFRGIDATRTPYEERSEGEYTDDADKVWDELNKKENFTVDLPSTYFIGSQAHNAEDVRFKDLARFQFLLHFLPFIAQIYAPREWKYDRKTKTEKPNDIGFGLVIPDIADLETFCDEFPEVLQSRSSDKSGYRPKESLIDLVAEGALDLMHKIDQRLAIKVNMQITDLLLGVDVLHVEKDGNNIRLWGNSRIDPIRPMIDEYVRVKERFKNQLFRKQRMLNVLNERKDWFYGFDSLLSKTDSEQTIGQSFFRSDIRKAFEDIGITNKTKGANNMDTTTQEVVPKTVEEIVYRLVGTYISAKLKSKYQLEWTEGYKGTPKEIEYNEKKGKVAREAFLAIRSRTESDFIDYFTSTLCAFPQFLNEQGYATLAKALHEESDKVRTLTMLALSARG